MNRKTAKNSERLVKKQRGRRSEWREVKWKLRSGVAKNSQRAANGYHRASRNVDERAAPCKQRQPTSNSSKQEIVGRKK